MHNFSHYFYKYGDRGKLQLKYVYIIYQKLFTNNPHIWKLDSLFNAITGAKYKNAIIIHWIKKDILQILQEVHT